MKQDRWNVFWVLTLGCWFGMASAYAKEYPWGQVTVVESDAAFVEFEWRVDWPESEPGSPDPLRANGIYLPGAQLTLGQRPDAPWRVGSAFVVPSGSQVALEILEADYQPLLDASAGDVNRWFRQRRYAEEIEWVPEDDVVGSRHPVVYPDSAFAVEEPLSLASVGQLRSHTVAQLQCFPLRIDRADDSCRRLERVRGRLVFQAPLPADAAGQRSVRFQSHSFDRMVTNWVVNPEDATRPTARGLRKRASRGLERRMTGVVPRPALVVRFHDTGLYRLRPSDFRTAGVDLAGIDTVTLQLFDDQGERSLWVDDGGDGQLDDGDEILFYGETLRSIYALDNAYILRWGLEAGARMDEAEVFNPDINTVRRSFSRRAHFEEEVHYWQNMVDGEGEDHWFWESQLNGPESRDYRIDLDGIAASVSDPVTLRVELKGLSSIPTAIPDHHTRLYFNGREVASEQWDGNARVILEGSLTVAELLEGENTVTVEQRNDLGLGLDQAFVNWIEVDYPRRLVAVDGTLAFGRGGDTSRGFAVAGFRNEAVMLLDTTDPRNPVRLVGADRMLQGAGYTISFEDRSAGARSYLALDELAPLRPKAIERVDDGQWRRPDRQADYLIVTHGPFQPGLAPLISRRTQQGLHVVTIPVEDLYVEFGSGVPTPDAIRRFVDYAYHHWQAPAPEFLLLVGDSTLDPRDLFGSGTPNYLPTEITEMSFFGESVSDDGLVSVDGDDFLPDVLVGRFPVQSLEELSLMVDKTLRYEDATTSEDWNERILVVADDDSEVFEELSESLVEQLPEGFEADRVFLREEAGNSPTGQILTRLNEGRVLVNYTGHGSRSTWGIGDRSGILLENENLGSLTNSDALTVVTVANCLNGFFVARATRPCLAEAFLRAPSGGAVAAWAPTSLGFPSGHRLLVGAFYDAVFQRGRLGLGAAVVQAKVTTLTDTTFFADQVRSYTLFGDPALQLALPTRLPRVVLGFDVAGDGVTLRFEVSDEFDYTVQVAGSVTGSDGWVDLADGPHNSGEVLLAVGSEVAAQFFRVRVALSKESDDTDEEEDEDAASAAER